VSLAVLAHHVRSGLLERLAREEAARFECEIHPVDGVAVRVDGERDGYRIVFRTVGPHGPFYAWVTFDASMPLDDTGQQVVARECQAVCKRLRSTARLRPGVAVLEIGAPCPEHGPAIDTIDHEQRRFRCGRAWHDFPQTWAAWNGQQYTERSRS
jgi:hypothetical protein